jgi:hypothetical protein
MNKTILFFLITSALVFANSNLTVIQESMANLETAARDFLFGATVILFIFGIIPTVIAVIIYLKKLKAVENKSRLWFAAAIILAIIGVMLLIGSILGVLLYFLMPVIHKAMIMG